MAVPWGAIISGGASLVSSLFGGKKEKTSNRVDYQQMVRDAEAAGFNPLTVLRNGGSAGYAVTSTGGTPLVSRVAEGLAAGTQNFLANFDPHADQAREASFKVHEATLANIQADTALKRMQLGSVPTYTASPVKRSVGSGVKHGQTFKSAADVLPPDAGKSKTPEVETPKITNPFPKRWDMEIDTGIPDISAAEDRYGDWVSDAAGVGVWLHDMDLNMKKNPERFYPLVRARNRLKKHFSKSYSSSTSRSVISDMLNGNVRRQSSPPLSGKGSRLRQYQ